MPFFRTKRKPYGQLIEQMIDLGSVKVRGFDKAGALCRYAKSSKAFEMESIKKDLFLMTPKKKISVKKKTINYIFFKC